MNHTPIQPSAPAISDFLAGFQERFLAFIERTQQLGQNDDQGFFALQQALLAFSRAQVPPDMLSCEEQEQFKSWTAAMDAYDLPKMQELRTAILRDREQECIDNLHRLRALQADQHFLVSHQDLLSRQVAEEQKRLEGLQNKIRTQLSDKIADNIVDKVRKQKQTDPE